MYLLKRENAPIYHYLDQGQFLSFMITGVLVEWWIIEKVFFLSSHHLIIMTCHWSGSSTVGAKMTKNANYIYIAGNKASSSSSSSNRPTLPTPFHLSTYGVPSNEYLRQHSFTRFHFYTLISSAPMSFFFKSALIRAELFSPPCSSGYLLSTNVSTSCQ